MFAAYTQQLREREVLAIFKSHQSKKSDSGLAFVCFQNTSESV